MSPTPRRALPAATARARSLPPAPATPRPASATTTSGRAKVGAAKSFDFSDISSSTPPWAPPPAERKTSATSATAWPPARSRTPTSSPPRASSASTTSRWPQTHGPCQRAAVHRAGAATDARLPAQPEVRYLAQLGFSSGLDPATYKRAPLHLVAVVDKSGSMSGHPLDLVRKSLHQIAGQLRPDDAISIVLYGDRAHVHLSPTPAARLGAIQASIDAIASARLHRHGGRAARRLRPRPRPRRAFAGQTRVMLFTDERPNVGRTDAAELHGHGRGRQPGTASA
jgi:hypothetical protein